MKRIPKRRCQKRLALVWLGGGALVGVLLVLQTLGGKYGGAANEAWGWYAATVVPTLSVVMGSVVRDLQQPDRGERVDAFLFGLAMAASALYVLLVAGVFGFASWQGHRPALPVLRESTLYLGLLQGLVAAALGVFFVDQAGEGEAEG